jgi:hypothetical protein
MSWCNTLVCDVTGKRSVLNSWLTNSVNSVSFSHFNPMDTYISHQMSLSHELLLPEACFSELPFDFTKTSYPSLTPRHQNPKVHHRIYTCLPLVPILSQLNPVYTPSASFPKIHSYPIAPSTSRSPEWSLSFGLSHQNLAHVSLLSHACHVPHPPHSPWLDVMISGNEYNYEAPQCATSSILLLLKPS